MGFLFRGNIYSIRMSYVKLFEYLGGIASLPKISALAETDDSANTKKPRFKNLLRITVVTCI